MEAIKNRPYRANATWLDRTPCSQFTPQTLGFGFQMVGQTHRTVKTAAKLGDRLQPRIGRDMEPIENRLQGLAVSHHEPARN